MAKRLLVACGLGLAVLIGSFAVSAPVPPPQKEPAWIGDRLQKTLDLPEIDDPKTTLKDALDLLTKKTDVQFTFNLKAFRNLGNRIDNPADLEVAATRSIPAQKGTLAEVLQTVLDTIETEEPLRYLVRGERLEILPESVLRSEIYGEDIELGFGQGGLQYYLPLVHLRVTERPFAEVLKDVAKQADVNILVDPRCGEKTKTEVTAKLVNTPADTAVELLADLAGFQMVRQRNVLYVTTAENAAKIRMVQERKLQLLNPFGPAPGVPFGPGLPGVPGIGGGGLGGPGRVAN